MPASLISDEGWEQWTEARTRRPRLAQTLLDNPPDFSVRLPSPPEAPAPLTAPPSAAPPVGMGEQPPARSSPPSTVDQFGDPTVSSAEASAACGPAAAIAFYQRTGRNMTVGEAVKIAEQNGLKDPGGGMRGPEAQQKLLSILGVPSRLERGVNWDAVRQDVAG